MPYQQYQERGQASELWRAINNLNKDVEATKPVAGRNVKVDKGIHGYTIHAQAGGDTTNGGINYLPYNYSSSYSEDDIVYYTGSTIKFESASVHKYTYAGIYICVDNVPSLAARATGSGQGLDMVPTYPFNESSSFHWLSFYPVSMSICPSTIWLVPGALLEPINPIEITIL